MGDLAMMLRHLNVFDGEKFLPGTWQMVLKNGIIQQMEEEASGMSDREEMDATGLLACPGLIDIHTHGLGMHDLEDPKTILEDAVRAYAIQGTTSLMPALMTTSPEETKRILNRYRNMGGPILGVHLEGPFLNAGKRGAHPLDRIQAPSIQAYEELIGDFGESVKRITIAPETDEGMRLSRHLFNRGILLSFGHTLCCAEEARYAFDAGYRLSTHTFNAMPVIHHRDPSITCAALLDDRIYCEIIPDGRHVHADMVRLLFVAKAAGLVVSVSDSVPHRGGLILEDGALYDAKGTLAGSDISLLEGIRNLIRWGIPIQTVLRSATANPAALLGLSDRIGMLRTGCDADLLLLDKSLRLIAVWQKGKRIGN